MDGWLGILMKLFLIRPYVKPLPLKYNSTTPIKDPADDEAIYSGKISSFIDGPQMIEPLQLKGAS